MARVDAATRHVVERCPCCGVEHDTSADTLCEACDTPLRAWCRAHSRETGWLDSAACPRCAEEARPARTAPSVAMPCPAPSLPSSVAPLPHSPAPGAAPVAAERGTPPAPMQLREHLVVMLLMMLVTAGGGTLAGVVAGFVYAFSGRGTLPDTALRCALGGVLIGMLAGAALCTRHVTSLRAPHGR